MFSPRHQPAARPSRAAFLKCWILRGHSSNEECTLFAVQSGGTEHAIVQIVPAKPAIGLSQALFTHAGCVPSGLQGGGSFQSISRGLCSRERPPCACRKSNTHI